MNKSDTEWLSGLIDSILIEFGLLVSIGVGGKINDLFQDIVHSFKQAKHALDYTFYSANGQLLIFSEIAYDPYKPALKAFQREKKLVSHVTQLNREQATEEMDALINQLLHDKYPSPIHLKESLLYVLLNQIKSAETLLRSEDVNNFIAEIEFQIPECSSLTELKAKSTFYLIRLIELIENRKNNKNQLIIQLCMEYMGEHYMEDLALDQIAQKFFFSPTYFSSFFKIHTLMTFTEYLLKLRLEKAKELLLDGERKISDVAASVGYRDAGYFIRLFKRDCGLSPDDYRKNLIR
jgi:two-component system response regulator YesN